MHLVNLIENTRSSQKHAQRLFALLWFFVVFVFAGIPAKSFAQQQIDALIKPGTKLIYRLHIENKFYDLVATVKTVEPVFAYDWSIADSTNASGSVTHTVRGLNRGNVLHHQFKSGANTLNNKETSLVLSTKTFDRLTGRFNRPTAIHLNGSKSEQYNMGLFDEPDQIKLRVNGNEITINEEKVKSLGRLARQYVATGEEFFTFYRSRNFPLILRLKILPSFEMEIIDINTP